MAGPGLTSSGKACDHGPSSPFEGAPRPSTSLKTASE